MADEVFGGERTVTLGGIRFFVLVCGENNFLYNIQSEGNAVCLRHEIAGQTLADLNALDYRIAFNPAHTEMGNIGKMYRRWEWLSKPNANGEARTCLFTTNADTQSSATRAMYCFENGSKRELLAKSNWPENRSWILEAIDI